MSQSLPETYRTIQVGVKRGQRQIQRIVHQRREGSAPKHHKFYRYLMFSSYRGVCWDPPHGKLPQSVSACTFFPCNTATKKERKLPQSHHTESKCYQLPWEYRNEYTTLSQWNGNLSSPHMTNCRHFWVWSKCISPVLYLFLWYSLIHQYFYIISNEHQTK